MCERSGAADIAGQLELVGGAELAFVPRLALPFDGRLGGLQEEGSGARVIAEPRGFARSVVEQLRRPVVASEQRAADVVAALDRVDARGCQLRVDLPPGPRLEKAVGCGADRRVGEPEAFSLHLEQAGRERSLEARPSHTRSEQQLRRRA